MIKRVYGSRRPASIDSFVGQDAWIRVKLRNPSCYSFIRVISADDDTYTFNDLDIRKVSKDGVCHCSESFKDSTLRYKVTKKKYEVQILPPLEIFSTDELFSINPS